MSHPIQDLHTTALVGTGRRPAPALPDLSALGITPADPIDAQHSVLDLAALADVQARGGQVATTATPISPAPAETQPEAPPAATRLLDLLLNQAPVAAEAKVDLIVVWLTTARERGLRVSPTLLPALFDLASSRVPVRGVLPSVWGERGAWLARVLGQEAILGGALGASEQPNPEHSGSGQSGSGQSDAGQAGEFAAFVADWPTLTSATATERLMNLRLLDPDAARDLVTERWTSLPARERNDLLSALGLKLGPGDEPLLEQGLDDKAKSVRETAQRLLGELPTSQYSQRMGARLAPLIVHHKGLLRSSLELALPPEPDPASIRDGYLPPAKGADPQPVAWLQTLVRRSPLSVWTDTTGLTPAKIVSLLGKDQAVAWLTAATRTQQDREFGRALFAATSDSSLLGLLDPQERQSWLMDQLKGSANGSAVATALGHTSKPWPEPVGLAILNRIGRNRKDDALSWSLTGQLATGLPASAMSRAQQVAEQLSPPIPENQDEYAAGRYRSALLAAIQYHSFSQSIQEAFR